MSFIANPSGVLGAYLGGMTVLPEGWDMYRFGKLAMTLEIMTVVKTLEGVAGSSLLALEKEEVISVLTGVLRSTGMEADGEEWYEMLAAWRRPTFVSEDPDTDRDDVASSLSVDRGGAAPHGLGRVSSPPAGRRKRPSGE